MKKLYVLILVLMVSVGLGLVPSKAQAQTIWDGTADASWYDASITDFYIYTPEELAGLAQLVNAGNDFNGKTIYLEDDIWLNANGSTTNNWTMIGGDQMETTKEHYANFFRGTFHGNGHYIYNMYCSRDNGSGGFYYHAGLFGDLKTPCLIDSLVIVNPITRATGGFQGSLAACIAPGGNVTISKILVINANINQNHSGVDGHNGALIGGVYPNEGATTYITNCGATGSVYGAYSGGLTGGGGGGIYTNCYFNGTTSGGSYGCGGIASHGGSLNNCYSPSLGGSDATNGININNVSLTNPSATLGDAFRADCLLPINGGYPLLEFMVCNDPTCGPVTGLTASNITGSSAQISWTPSHIGTPMDYTLEYMENGTGNWMTESGITTNSFILSGLNPSTLYNVRVATNCDNGYSGDWVTTNFMTTCLVVGEVAIGNGTSTAVQYPVNNYYNYSFTQQIFTAADLEYNANTFTGISFQYANSSASTSKNNVNIYLRHTTKSSFSGSSDFISIDSAQLVYSGALNCSNGWNEFTFNTPFEYNGTDNIALIVDDNSGGYNGSSYVFNTHETSGTMCIVLYSDSQNPDPASPSSSSASSSSYSYRNNVKFHFCNQNSTCAAPNMSLSNITSESVEVEWVPGYTEAAWELEYKSSADTDWTQYGTVTSMDEVIYNLNPNTQYVLRMRSDCGGEYSPWTTATFKTQCGPIMQLPYTDDFQNYANSSMPDCWAIVSSNTSTYPRISSGRIQSAGNTIFAAPILGVDIETLQVTFDLEREGSSSGTFDLGVMSDPTDASTFELVSHYDPAVNVVLHNTVYLNEVTTTGPNNFIAFRQNSTVTNFFYWVDNINVDYVPVCVPPTMTLGTVSVDEATLNWNDDQGSQTEWEFVYGAPGFDPDNAVATPVYGTPTYTLTGLSNNTQYEAYVRAVCGSDVSDWSNVVPFMTLPGLPASTPYFCDFEDADENGSWALINGSQTNKWYIGVPTGATDSVLFVSDNGTSSTYNTGSTSNVWAYRDIQFGAGAEFNLSFLWKCYGESSYDYIQVFIGNPTNVTDGSDTQPAGSVMLTNPRLNQSNNWQRFGTMLSSEYANTTKRLYFLWHNDGSSGSNPPAIIDSIQITVSECGRPNNLTATGITPSSIDVRFDPALSTDYAWEYVVCPANGNPDSETPISISDTFFTAAGLNANTTYNIYVRTVCDNGGYSAWSNMLSATTDCGPITQLPFTETFDTPNANNYVNCWSRYASDPSHYVYLYGDVTPPTGQYSLDFHWTPNCSVIAIMPAVDDNINVSDLMASFWIQRTGTTSVFEVGVMTNKDDHTTFEPLDTIPSPTVDLWHYIDVPLSQYTGTGKYIAFRVTQGTSCGFRMDDITLDYIPSCWTPSNFTVSNVTATSADLSWTPVSSESEWIVEYKSDSDPDWNVMSSYTTSLTISGLDSNTTYSFRVKANCGAGDESNYTSVITTNTLPCSNACVYVITMNDSYGDGWNGNTINILANTVPVDTATIASGNSNTITYYQCGTAEVSFSWTSGSFASETSFTISDGDGNTLYTCSNGNNLASGAVFFTHTCGTISCPKPTSFSADAVTQTDVTLSWVENGTATTWNIVYGAPGFDPNIGGTLVTAYTNPFTVTGLSAATHYDFYVQSDCGGDASFWSNVVSVTTECDLISLPYVENFESYAGTTYSSDGPTPLCWTTTTTNTSYPAPHVTSSSATTTYCYPHSGTNCMVFTCGSGGADAYAVLPTFDQPLNTLHLNFYRQMESTSSGTLTVGYVTSFVNTASFVTVATIPSLSGTGDTISVDFTGVDIPAIGNIAFHWNYSTSYYSCCIDDINVTLAGTPGPGTTCDVPTNLAVSNITTTGATATWTAGGTESAWNLQYKAASAADWSNSINVTAPTYAFTGLTPNTQYQVRVQAACDATTTSDWTAAVSFATAEESGETCVAPSNLTSTGTAAHSIDITWTENGTATSWAVYYRVNGASSWITETVNATTYTITGLEPETEYTIQVVANCADGVTSEPSNTINVTTRPDGIEDYDAAAVSVFPNPTTGMVQVSSTKYQVSGVDVYDVYGKLLKTDAMMDNSTVDMSGYAAGVYFLRVSTENGVVTKRVVKK